MLASFHQVQELSGAVLATDLILLEMGAGTAEV